MKILLKAVLAGLILTSGLTRALAQTETYDLATFTPPAGWQVQHRPTDVVLTCIDQGRGIYCIILISQSQMATGDPVRDFPSEWKALVEASFTTEGYPPPSQRRTDKGLRYLEGNAVVRKGNTQHYITLMVFAAGSRLQSIFLLVPNRAAIQAFESPINGFLGSLRFSSSALPTQAGRTTPTAATGPAPGDPGSFKGGGISGVWMGFKSGMYGSYEPSPRWVTFYDDGQVFTDIPATGLAGFDRRASQADANQRAYWGTYSLSGGSGLIQKPGVNYPTRITVKEFGRIALDSDSYYRSASVDGLRLEGAWTSYANPNDPALGRQPIGQRPVIRFSRDGRFSDEGVFAAFLHTSYGGDPAVDRAGTGTYQIQNYSLVLRYDDGRVKLVAFTGLLGGDPATTNDIIYLRRSRFNRIR